LGAKNDRVERKKVMALAQARRIDAILLTEVSRWGRSTQDLVQRRPARLEGQHGGSEERSMSILLKLLLLFAFAALCELALVLMFPDTKLGSNPLLIFIARLVGAAIAVFVIGGLIPVIVRAFRRFAKASANAVMIVWALPIAGFVYFQYYDLANP
jgi:O-antigen/teichoic acid export membrane protein